MSSVVLLAGSPSPVSKSSALLKRAGNLLAADGVDVTYFHVHDFSAEDLLHGRWQAESIARFQAAVAASAGLVISTPVYKASFSGLLKIILDFLPEKGLEGKSVLALASGGSPSHLLAVDYSLLPVLFALKARYIVGTVYATDKQFDVQDDGQYAISQYVESRLLSCLSEFSTEVLKQGSSFIHPHDLPSRIRGASITI